MSERGGGDGTSQVTRYKRATVPLTHLCGFRGTSESACYWTGRCYVESKRVTLFIKQHTHTNSTSLYTHTLPCVGNCNEHQNDANNRGSYGIAVRGYQIAYSVIERAVLIYRM